MAVSPTRKVCPVCGQEKSIRHSFYRWRDSRTGHMRTARLCKVCSRARAQERNARVMADAYTADLERKRRTAYRRTHPRPDDAAKSRSYRERLKETNPEVYEQQIADARIRKGQRRDSEAPSSTRRWAIAAHRAPSKAETVSADPLRRYVLARFPGWTLHEIAEVTGRSVSDKLLSRVLREHAATIELDVADRFLTLGLGRPDLLLALYPPEPA
jgi:hypothetical protein